MIWFLLSMSTSAMNIAIAAIRVAMRPNFVEIKKGKIIAAGVLTCIVINGIFACIFFL
ncbi:MAG TPA: hypothetical protein PKN48_01000 [Bacteroidales bacterium]|nr:hypothetical protein [Bacteroidales bacterium]